MYLLFTKATKISFPLSFVCIECQISIFIFFKSSLSCRKFFFSLKLIKNSFLKYKLWKCIRGSFFLKTSRNQIKIRSLPLGVKKKISKQNQKYKNFEFTYLKIVRRRSDRLCNYMDNMK